MHNQLQILLKDKQSYVECLKRQHTISLTTTKRHSPKSFYHALCQPGLNIIAEIKRRSPSRGNLATIADPVALATTYAASGACAISVLTDQHFAGCIEDLARVTHALRTTSCCVLRKDFIIDPIQIAEAVLAGADAVLLIVAVLQKKTARFIQLCQEMNIDALVEVHTAAEMAIAVSAKAKIIGINNRNLTDFSVDTERALTLYPNIPTGVVSIAESGISTAELAQCYQKTGFNAILVGEALVTEKDPSPLIHAFRGHHAN